VAKRNRKAKGHKEVVVAGAMNGGGKVMRTRKQERALDPAMAGLEAQKVFQWCVEELPGSVFEVLVFMFNESLRLVEGMGDSEGQQSESLKLVGEQQKKEE